VKVASIINVFGLTNAGGMQAEISNYGGTVLSLTAPDRDGRFDDVVLGHDSITTYFNSGSYFGALIGRYANRIAHGRFALEGQTYELARNDGPHHLHGGLRGYDKVVWVVEDQAPQHLAMRYRSPDCEEGYPGNLEVQVTFSLTDTNDLVLDYLAITDRPTPVNLTHHSYFNLAGHGNGNVLGHIMQINADTFTPVSAELIPTGEVRSVAGTPFDFRIPTSIGSRINDDDEQLRHGRGYDHNFVLNGERDASRLAARVMEPTTGRMLEIFTTHPGLQFYSGNFLAEAERGKQGVFYGKHSGFALETQHFPDSPNHSNFPDTVLRPAAEYRERTIYRFTTE
jgi:aldose 1-epimerase